MLFIPYANKHKQKFGRIIKNSNACQKNGLKKFQQDGIFEINKIELETIKKTTAIL